MKKILLILISVLPICAAAQSFTNLSLKEAQHKAAESRKIILVDVMNMTTMNDAKLAQEKSVLDFEGVKQFLDNHVISIRIDMGAPAGKEFAPLLQMNMYPTYAFLMPNGDLLGVLSPFMVAKDNSVFLTKAKEYYAMAKEKWANSREILFENISFDAALAQAKKENKLLFIDAYTDNCQPCLRMAKNVFTIDRVADFYNENFINLKLNFGTEHKDLADRYKTVGYPSYLFLDGDANLIHMGLGYTEPDGFINYGKEALAKRKIQFTQGSWKDILQKAKRENKPIFMDCYTVWCGPCKQMDAQVFTNPEVAAYFNEAFINVKFDMEKGEGIELKNRYGISAYPTFLYINPDGEVINRIVGSMPAQNFLEKSKSGMSEKGLAAMQRRYVAGERSQTFLKDYISVLEASYLQKETEEAIGELFKTAEMSLLKTPEYWKLFDRYVKDPDTEVFKYVYKNRDEFAAIFNTQPVENKLYNVWSDGSRAFIKSEDGKTTLDSKGFDQYLKRMKSESVKNYDLIAINAQIHNADKMDNWKEYFKLLEKKIKRYKIENIPEYELFNWGVRIEKGCKDQKLRAKAAKWMASGAEIAKEREAKRKETIAKSGGGMMAAMSMINYPNELARLAKALEK